MVVFLPLLTLIAKKVIPSSKVNKFLHSKILISTLSITCSATLDKSLDLLCLCFLSCKSWENHNDPTWGSSKSTFQAGGVMYRKEWQYLCLLAKKTEIWNSLPSDFGKWYMVCPSVPTSIQILQQRQLFSFLITQKYVSRPQNLNNVEQI